ncbi:uncharacterized protein AMSG_04580 [Thecamonas trahens ATCC 50062]|uniref:J domain-containing protein n=1 Tax=Thecamonas trahens ATCC 50062 TaxID=461836 RepID=A0A0L0D9B8_THETB|nr:hypothetical protein AMSG_04580 [Thecamonas trahens ATCC 50062]KNC48835.1 hypothetical protein AMSG_04580 [Thecamonas trahens ATCC 50062]|eukprot:XP_013758255.1 hypothetical protein AMSG_04580 [Thecamonas trahens ATCC 50062]
MALVDDGDYYGLFGVTAESPSSLILTQRRELTRMLHPDNFDDPAMQASATQVLSRINLAYQNVLRNEASREIYNELCELRLYYPLFGTKRLPSIHAAAVRDSMQSLYSRMKSANMPQTLLAEALLVVDLLNKFILAWNEHKRRRAKAKAKAKAGRAGRRR